ncbi:MAG: hypothetical protein DRI57_21160 [Deltaproteobacteria bacterium]|nr:MAG: hypothetical protein DRI57_21160 [Deltaproteobacteria bacterium]
MHQAETAGRGCKPRPAHHGSIKTDSYDLSLMHMGSHPPVPGVACGQDRHTVERPARSADRESCRPQGVRRTLDPEAWHSTVMSKNADGDVFDVTEACTKESSVPLRSLPQHPKGGIPEGGGSAGVIRARHV